MACAATLMVGVFSALAPSYWWYFVMRLLSGAGAAGIGQTAFLLATEAVGPGWRAPAVLATGALSATHNPGAQQLEAINDRGECSNGYSWMYCEGSQRHLHRGATMGLLPDAGYGMTFGGLPAGAAGVPGAVVARAAACGVAVCGRRQPVHGGALPAGVAPVAAQHGAQGEPIPSLCCRPPFLAPHQTCPTHCQGGQCVRTCSMQVSPKSEYVQPV